jgi:50S ribosomal protein L16 3-hydroxylase
VGNLGLCDLLAPISKSEFLNGIWPYRPLFIPAQKNKLAALMDLPLLQNLENILAERKTEVRACLPDFEDEYSSILVRPADAIKTYRNGMSLVLESMQSQHPLIQSMLENLKMELGLPTAGETNLCKAKSMAYAACTGSRTRLHFDANVNFVIQLQGKKLWHLAENHSVDNPTERFTTGAPEIPLALEKQCHAPLIDELPHDATEYLMEPGCVLFVPRGYWHATETIEDSLSLNFTFSQPTWSEVFAKSLQEFLFQSPEWRELADGIESPDPKRRELANERLNKLMQQLSKELPSLTAKQLLSESGFIK